MIRKIMPIPPISLTSRNPQLSQDRRKKKEQADTDAKFKPIEPVKQDKHTRDA